MQVVIESCEAGKPVMFFCKVGKASCPSLLRPRIPKSRNFALLIISSCDWIVWFNLLVFMLLWIKASVIWIMCSAWNAASIIQAEQTSDLKRGRKQGPPASPDLQHWECRTIAFFAISSMKPRHLRLHNAHGLKMCRIGLGSWHPSYWLAVMQQRRRSSQIMQGETQQPQWMDH